MNRIKYLSVLLFCVITLPLFAQQQSLAEQRRQCLLKTILLLEDYEYYSILDDEDAREGFKSLFVNEEVKVYNDLLGLSSAEYLTVKEYVELRKGTKIPTTVIKNINKETVNYDFDGNVWRVRCTFDKELSYSDMCGIQLSSKEFYKVDHKLVVSAVYDPETGSCKIEKIEGNIDSNRRLSEDYAVFMRTSPLDDQIKYEGKNFQFNAYEQAFMEKGFDKSKMVFKDPDVTAVPVLDPNCSRIITVNYKARRIRIKPHYDLGFGEAVDMQGSDKLSESKSKTSSFGLDLGYVLPSKSSVKLGLFAGLGMSNTNIDLAFKKTDYSYDVSLSQDVNGETYDRHYLNLNMSQGIKFTEITVPLYLDIDFRFSSIASFYADLGAQLNLNMSHSVSSTECSAYVYGIYHQYNDLYMDETWGYNGFGNVTNPIVDSPDLENISTFTADLLGRAGLRINIPSTPFALDLGVSYQMGLMNIISANSSPVSFDSGCNASNALVFNTISGLNSTEHVRNLTEAFDGVKRKAMKLNIGLIYKL